MSRPEDHLRDLRIDRRPGAARPTSNRKWIVLGAIVTVVAVGAVLMSGRPTPVDTSVARSAADAGPPTLLDASGFVTARRIATVSSKVTGRVAEVLIEEGMKVEEGQLLARLDATDASAQLELASAQQASSESQLAEARTQLALAETTLKRQQELIGRQLVAQSAFDQAKADRDARAARLASLEKAVEVARDQRALTAIGVDNTQIRAPFAGVIVAKAAQPGEMISPVSAGGGFTRTGIGTLVDMDSLEVNVDVNEAYIGRVQPKMVVNAVLNAYPDWTIPGSVIAIVPTADRTKATVKVRIALDSKDPRIVPDMGVRVSFLAPVDADAPKPTGAFVPEAAIVQPAPAAEGEEPGRPAVFVVEDGVAKRIEVTLGEEANAERHVTAGLNGGEAVIVAPPKGLADGARVVVNAAAGR
ncbi:efflux RND transporter periplasmic adaptor subunit [Silanimonas sp.]|jgi:RND family efflux transporter MFP subunit|uniref:efflux RND transporter periplasmic adaptor subunit n=1 Tax=Silanimonas sp. TaxID=1929290 RepID=UPI0022BDB673|nr:efflux RND transporter periplasmic adaptor subunit [Silanimonas sp.]MCZ8063678.1 efflux RND transporter periplasmic adaptor subunit [Silanimonas sp.]